MYLAVNEKMDAHLRRWREEAFANTVNDMKILRQPYFILLLRFITMEKFFKSIYD